MMQKNWIGRSEGANIAFVVHGTDLSLDVFTTRPDTLFGATYMVISPEHPIVDTLNLKEDNDILVYCNNAKKKSELQRTDLEKDKTGIFTGYYAVNPINYKRIKICRSSCLSALV